MNNELLLKAREKVPDAKTLIILASKRARQLATGAAPMVRSKSENFLDVALEEIGEGLLIPNFDAKHPGLGFFSRADREIGVFRHVGPPTGLVSNFLRSGRAHV